MKLLAAALAVVMGAAVAHAAQAPDTSVVTGPSFQQMPLSNSLVTVGGTQTTVGAALSAGVNGCPKTGCTFTGGVGFTTFGTAGSGVFGAATGNQISINPQPSLTMPQIQAVGADANIDIVLFAKGTGVVRTSSGVPALRGYHLSSRPDLNGGTVWAGNAAEGVSNIFVAGGVSGVSGTSDAGVNFFAIASDTMDCRTASGGFCSGLELSHNFGGALMHGNRNGINSLVNLISKTANATGVGGSYVGGQFTMQGGVNDNGTAGTGNGKGLLYGINPVASLTTSAATFFKQLTAMEANVYVVTGASVEDKVGIQVVQTLQDKVQGSEDDVAISINNQNGAVGWTYGLEFGRAGGIFPITTSGTLIYGQGNLGAAFTVANGVDWHLGTATGNWLQFGSVFAVSGSGIVKGPITTWTDTQTCTAGQITWDAGFIYVCTATNTVKRATLATF